jgi:hypothetical protein
MSVAAALASSVAAADRARSVADDFDDGGARTALGVHDGDEAARYRVAANFEHRNPGLHGRYSVPPFGKSAVQSGLKALLIAAYDFIAFWRSMSS